MKNTDFVGIQLVVATFFMERKEFRNVDKQLPHHAMCLFLHLTEAHSVTFLVVQKYTEKNMWSDKSNLRFYS